MKLKFKSGDKIVIHEGNKLHNFKGNYSDVFDVVYCYEDITHGVEFVEFYADGKKYAYPSRAFDLVEK